MVAILKLVKRFAVISRLLLQQLSLSDLEQYKFKHLEKNLTFAWEMKTVGFYH